MPATEWNARSRQSVKESDLLQQYHYTRINICDTRILLLATVVLDLLQVFDYTKVVQYMYIDWSTAQSYSRTIFVPFTDTGRGGGGRER